MVEQIFKSAVLRYHKPSLSPLPSFASTIGGSLGQCTGEREERQ